MASEKVKAEAKAAGRKLYAPKSAKKKKPAKPADE